MALNILKHFNDEFYSLSTIRNNLQFELTYGLDVRGEVVDVWFDIFCPVVTLPDVNYTVRTIISVALFRIISRVRRT